MGSENLRGTGWPPDSEGDLGFWGGPDPGQEGQAAGDLRPPQPPPRVRRPGADPVSTLRYLLSYLYVGCLLTASVMVFFAIGFGWPWLEDHISHLPGIELVNDYRPDLSSQLLSSDGSVVAEFFVERRRKRLARFDDLPKNLVNALIATEDQQFWKHHGINPVRFAKAVFRYLSTGSRSGGGGSTITQQLCKDLFTKWEMTPDRKIREALYALKIEQELSKEEILTIYLNQVHFGHNWSGIWAASEGYFGKTPMELNLAECATLVGLLKANTRYSPILDPARSKTRRGVILKAMLEEGYITEEEYKQALDEELLLRNKHTETPERVNRYPYWRSYFEERVFRPSSGLSGVLPTNDQIGASERESIRTNGFKIKTTLDPVLQEWAEESLRKALVGVEKQRRKSRPGAELPATERPHFADKIHPNATLLGKITGFVEPNWLTVQLENSAGNSLAVVAVPHPGPDDWRARFEVLAPPYFVQVKALERVEGEIPEQDIIDRGLVSKQKLRFALIDEDADPHAQGAMVTLEVGTGRVLSWVGGYDWSEEAVGRQRIRCIEGHQPGSSFKPIVFASAFERGYTPATRVSNAPYEIWLPSGLWRPKNYEKGNIGGVFSIRDIIKQSLNIPTVRVFETLIGQAYEFDPMTQQQTLAMARRLGIHSPIPRELSAALGTADITPLEMATAFSVFANDGVLVEPYAIESIETRDGQLAYKHLQTGNPSALDKDTTFLITDCLVAVMREQSGTGYTRAKDFPFPIAGKTGTTNLYYDAWFVGFSKNLCTAVWIGHDRRRSLGHGMAGGAVALPPWLSFMRKAIPHHLEKYRDWTAERIASASGGATLPSHPLAFGTPSKEFQRVEICAYSKNKPNSFCNTVWMWVKKGEGPSMVCRDCGIRYTDAPVLAASATYSASGASTAVLRPIPRPAAGASSPQRPMQTRRLRDLPGGGSVLVPVGPQVELNDSDRGFVPDSREGMEEAPPLPPPAIPRPAPRGERSRI
ncbi:MAG: Monofunctional biosynthetic peptidoglycan transglycosylase [bacterium]|nr:Monofunctional biosynthetic peptidoglycan transglycosylase [bacterium]